MFITLVEFTSYIYIYTLAMRMGFIRCPINFSIIGNTFEFMTGKGASF